MRLRAFLTFVSVALTGCSSLPTPRADIVRWGVVDVRKAATAHADSIFGLAYEVLPTGSMEPYLVGGDNVVGDFDDGFDRITPGDVLLYDANWADPTIPLVCHMAVERTGDRWIMTGIANQYSESGSRALAREDYRAKVVGVYTSRLKP